MVAPWAQLRGSTVGSAEVVANVLHPTQVGLQLTQEGFSSGPFIVADSGILWVAAPNGYSTEPSLFGGTAPNLQVAPSPLGLQHELIRRNQAEVGQQLHTQSSPVGSRGNTPFLNSLVLDGQSVFL